MGGDGLDLVGDYQLPQPLPLRVLFPGKVDASLHLQRSGDALVLDCAGGGDLFVELGIDLGDAGVVFAALIFETLDVDALFGLGDGCGCLSGTVGPRVDRAGAGALRLLPLAVTLLQRDPFVGQL